MCKFVTFITMRRVALFAATVSLLSSGSGFAQQGGAWTLKADMPTARGGLASSVVNGKIYVIGGHDQNFSSLRTTEEYDPLTNTWTSKAAMPTARNGHGAVAVNGRIYVIGGSRSSEYLKTVEEYDPATNTWTAKANMPTARSGLKCSAVGGKIYAMGGEMTSGPNSFTYFSVVEEYDPITNTWRARANMPIPRFGFASDAVGGQIYVMGGSNNSGWPQAVHAYNPATNTWTTKAGIPTPRDYVGAATLNGIIYVIGGDPDGGGSSLVTVEAYDPVSDRWATKTDMLQDRLDLTAAAANGKIYVFGGVKITFPDFTVLAKVEQYDPNPTSVKDHAAGLPASFALQQNYPNPFSARGISTGVAFGNPETVINFALPEAGKVTLRVYSETGQLVATLAESEINAGRHTATWNGHTPAGALVASGIYFYQLVAQRPNGEVAFTETRRMTLVK